LTGGLAVAANTFGALNIAQAAGSEVARRTVKKKKPRKS